MNERLANSKPEDRMTDLQKMENILLLLTENSHDIISYTLPSGQLSYVSPAVRTLLGYHPEELVGTSGHALFHPDDNEQVQTLRQTFLATNDASPLTARVRHKDGHYIWFETTLRAALDSNGNLLGLIGIGRDITEHKNLENRLEHAQRLARVGSWERNFRTGEIYWSPEVFDILGIPQTKHVTTDMVKERLHPLDCDGVFQAFQKAEQGLPYDIEFRIIRPDGEMRHIHSIGEFLYDGGEIVGMYGSLQDISSYKSIEEDLRRSKDNLKLAQRIGRFGHWDYDVQTKQLYFSSAFCQLWGVHDTALLTKDIMWNQIHEADQPKLLRTKEMALTNGTFDIEFRIVPQPGDIRTLHAIGEVTFGADGIPLRWFGVTQDVTARKQTEELLARSEMLSAVGQLAAGLAHEIRNPLTSLKGFTQLMFEKYQDTTYYDIMMSELTRIEGIVSELLVLAKPQAVQVQSNPLDSLIIEVIRLLESEALLHNVSMQVATENERYWVTCEGNQIKQVFINLIKNGIEAMPSGGKLDIQLSRYKGFVRVVIQDEGTGIPPDILAKLGEPFVSTKANGMGLGMMVCKKIIQDHQGLIGVDSEVGVGTKITVELPEGFTPPFG